MTPRPPSIARDEALLQAWHDGEAGPAERAMVEVWLAEDPAVAERLAALAAGDALLRAAVDAPLAEPLPPALLARVEATLAGQLSRLPARPAANGGGVAGAAPLRRWLPAALAAGLALAIALPAAWFWSAATVERRLAAREAERAAAHATALAALEDELQRTLETQVSGTPLPWLGGASGGGEVLAVRTYKSSGGHWCREYRVTAELLGQPFAERGIACRDAAGRWQRRILLLDGSEGAAEPGGLPAAAPASAPDPGQGT